MRDYSTLSRNICSFGSSHLNSERLGAWQTGQGSSVVGKWSPQQCWVLQNSAWPSLRKSEWYEKFAKKIISKNCQHRHGPLNCLLTAHRQVPAIQAAVAAPIFMEEIAPYLKLVHAGIPSHLSCIEELWSQGTGWVTTVTSRYWRELAALPGWKLRGLQQVGVGLYLLWERAGIQCAGGNYGIRLPDGTTCRTWTKWNESSQKHGNRRVAPTRTQFCCHHYIWPADDNLPN